MKIRKIGEMVKFLEYDFLMNSLFCMFENQSIEKF